MTSPVEVARLMGGDEAEFGSSSSSSTKVLRTTDNLSCLTSRLCRKGSLHVSVPDPGEHAAALRKIKGA
eukprot:CAMPEP_0114656652 /NCGR_PEP_ID=MMETSP0191-20121206/12681_1 /TAXON_ID=126664 /ORGANISM="Sorites sp." /LENGTH=68 /DNA_ID=CAMNT_0001874327 /DNA_START=31 /DNA_END=236 /DNA_ORIENTATION=+